MMLDFHNKKVPKSVRNLIGSHHSFPFSEYPDFTKWEVNNCANTYREHSGKEVPNPEGFSQEDRGYCITYGSK